jgi:hypothetical protein
MTIDRTTKLLLLLIGLGLVANILVPLLRPSRISAASSFACKGELKANAWGGTTATIGGYNVDVTCE